MELSMKDRIFLYNQYEILKSLKSDDEYEQEQCNYYQEILSEGYKFNYDDLIEGFDKDIPDSVSQFVLDVLQMYRTLTCSYIELSAAEKEQINKYDITYHGFDGNEEGNYYTYSKFVLEKKHDFEEIYNNGDVELNSHCNKVQTYSNMLSNWNDLGTGRYNTLSLNQMKKTVER